jgi:isopenicillin N synthase-like dioxygenase
MTAALKATHISDAALPIIDVGGLSSAVPSNRLAVSQRLREACLDNGFFYVANHGVPAGLVDAVFAETKNFFDRTHEQKSEVDKRLSPCNRGYEPLRAQTLEAGAPPDLKESFYIGTELSLDDPLVVARRFNQGANLWPSDMPGFAPTMKAYFAAMQDLSERLMRGIALSLELEENYFSRFCKDAYAILRLLHYPPQPANAAPGEKGAGAHTDFGALTILLQDQVGGLQVQGNAPSEWIHATPVAGTYVVNLGDMIARWTSGRYRSTVHRVVNASGGERYSVPFFFDGRIDHVVECLPSCLAPGESPKYPPTTVEGHLQEMYRRTYT